jgi:hypothetical protein
MCGILPLVITRHWNETAVAFECIAEERLRFDVSARALKVAARNSFNGFDHHRGTRPHRICDSSRLLPVSVTTSTGSVGQML